jgi:TMEM175 potassium channel family protein
VTTSRLETFADGVFAIAATLLILDVRTTGSDLGQSLLHIWPSYVAYAVSFLTIGIMWVNHHTVFEQIDRVNRRFLFINVGLLLCIAFVPFPTRLVAEHIRDEGAKAATLAYGLTLTITAIFFYLLWFVGALRGGLLKDDADQQVVDGISRSYRPGSIMYGGATLVALFSPQASAALYVAIALVYVIESSFFARV